MNASTVVLVQKASAKPMDAAARERQLVSLAFGNIKLENDSVTRAAILEAVRSATIRR